MKRAKLFKNGQSQAVRLPKEFRFEGDEVFVQQTADGVLLIPIKQGWARLKKALDELHPLFPEREQPTKEESREELL